MDFINQTASNFNVYYISWKEIIRSKDNFNSQALKYQDGLTNLNKDPVSTYTYNPVIL